MGSHYPNSMLNRPNPVAPPSSITAKQPNNATNSQGVLQDGSTDQTTAGDSSSGAQKKSKKRGMYRKTILKLRAQQEAEQASNAASLGVITGNLPTTAPPTSAARAPRLNSISYHDSDPQFLSKKTRPVSRPTAIDSTPLFISTPMVPWPPSSSQSSHRFFIHPMETNTTVVGKGSSTTSSSTSSSTGSSTGHTHNPTSASSEAANGNSGAHGFNNGVGNQYNNHDTQTNHINNHNTTHASTSIGSSSNSQPSPSHNSHRHVHHSHQAHIVQSRHRKHKAHSRSLALETIGGKSSTNSKFHKAGRHLKNRIESEQQALKEELAMLADEAEAERQKQLKRDQAAAERILKRAQVVKHLRGLKSRLASAQFQMGQDFQPQNADIFSEIFDEVLEDIGRDDNDRLSQIDRELLDAHLDEGDSEAVILESPTTVLRRASSTGAPRLKKRESSLPRTVISLDDDHEEFDRPKRSRHFHHHDDHEDGSKEFGGQYIGQSWEVEPAHEDPAHRSNSGSSNIISVSSSTTSSPGQYYDTRIDLPIRVSRTLPRTHEELQDQQLGDLEDLQQMQMQQLQELQRLHKQQHLEFQQLTAAQIRRSTSLSQERQLSRRSPSRSISPSSIYSRPVKQQANPTSSRQEPFCFAEPTLPSTTSMSAQSSNMPRTTMDMAMTAMEQKRLARKVPKIGSMAVHRHQHHPQQEERQVTPIKQEPTTDDELEYKDTIQHFKKSESPTTPIRTVSPPDAYEQPAPSQSRNHRLLSPERSSGLSKQRLKKRKPNTPIQSTKSSTAVNSSPASTPPLFATSALTKNITHSDSSRPRPQTFNRALLNDFGHSNPGLAADDFCDFVLSDPPDYDVDESEVEDLLNANFAAQGHTQDLQTTPTSNTFRWYQEQEQLAQGLRSMPKMAPLDFNANGNDEDSENGNTPLGEGGDHLSTTLSGIGSLSSTTLAGLAGSETSAVGTFEISATMASSISNTFGTLNMDLSQPFDFSAIGLDKQFRETLPTNTALPTNESWALYDFDALLAASSPAAGSRIGDSSGGTTNNGSSQDRSTKP